MNQKRDQLQLNGERIFNDMDRHNLGYISINNFANWVADNCGYQIADEDLPALETSLDGLNDYRITKDAFIETVSALPEDEEGERVRYALPPVVVKFQRVVKRLIERQRQERRREV